jgi:hypothetical protein
LGNEVIRYVSSISAISVLYFCSARPSHASSLHCLGIPFSAPSIQDAGFAMKAHSTATEYQISFYCQLNGSKWERWSPAICHVPRGFALGRNIRPKVSGVTKFGNAGEKPRDRLACRPGNLAPSLGVHPHIIRSNWIYATQSLILVKRSFPIP